MAYAVSQNFTTAVKDITARKSCIVLFSDLFFSTSDFTDSGVTFSQFFNTSDDLTWGDTPSDTINFGVVANGALSGYGFGKARAYLGVQIASEPYAFGDIYAHIEVEAHTYTASSLGLYRDSTQIDAGEYVSLVSDGTYIYAVGLTSSVRVKNSDGTVASYVPNRFMAQKLRSGLSVVFTQETRYFGKVTLDGSERWYKIASPVEGFRNSGSAVLPGRKASGIISADGFTYVGNALADFTGANWELVYGSNMNLHPDLSVTGTTIESFKEWLAENPMEVTYELTSSTATSPAYAYDICKVYVWDGENVLTYEYVPMGVYNVVKPRSTAGDTVVIQDAYDNMSLFDRDATAFLDSLTFPITLSGIYTALCNYVGVSYVTSTFTYSTESYASSPFSENSCTCRDILWWIAEKARRVAHCDRIGRMDLMEFGSSAVESLRASDIGMDGYSIAEYKTPNVTGVLLRSDSGSTLSFGDTTTCAYVISSNPFVGTISNSDLQAYYAIPTYVPMECTVLEADPSVDLGDMIDVRPAVNDIEVLTNVYKEVYATLYTLQNQNGKAVSDPDGTLLAYSAAYAIETPTYKIPLMQRTLRFINGMRAEYVATGNEHREADISNTEYNANVAPITQEDVFNRLTNGGEAQGIYLEDGKIYVNAEYIMSGTVNSNLVLSGSVIAENITIRGGTIDMETSEESDDKIILWSRESSAWIRTNGFYVCNSEYATNPNLRAAVNGGGIYLTNTETGKALVLLTSTQGFGYIRTNLESGVRAAEMFSNSDGGIVRVYDANGRLKGGLSYFGVYVYNDSGIAVTQMSKSSNTGIIKVSDGTNDRSVISISGYEYYSSSGSLLAKISATSGNIGNLTLSDGTKTRAIVNDGGVYIYDSSGTQRLRAYMDGVKLSNSSGNEVAVLSVTTGGIGNLSLKDGTNTRANLNDGALYFYNSSGDEIGRVVNKHGTVTTESGSATNVNTATWTTIGTISNIPSSGTKIFNICAAFATNTTGYRQIALMTTSSATSSMDNNATIWSNGMSGVNTRLQFTYAYKGTATTLYIRAYQNSGSQLSTTAYWNYVVL